MHKNSAEQKLNKTFRKLSELKEQKVKTKYKYFARKENKGYRENKNPCKRTPHTHTNNKQREKQKQSKAV